MKRGPLRMIRGNFYFWRGVRFEREGDEKRARTAYEKALRSGDPEIEANAGLVLGKMLAASGNLPDARSVLERTTKYRDLPREAVNWAFQAAVGLEAVCELQGDTDGARRAQALAFELEDWVEPAIDLDRGSILADFGSASGAERAYRRAIAANHSPWSAIAAHSLGGLLARKGDAEGACAAYEIAVSSGDERVAGSARSYIDGIRARGL